MMAAMKHIHLRKTRDDNRKPQIKDYPSVLYSLDKVHDTSSTSSKAPRILEVKNIIKYPAHI